MSKALLIRIIFPLSQSTPDKMPDESSISASSTTTSVPMTGAKTRPPPPYAASDTNIELDREVEQAVTTNALGRTDEQTQATMMTPVTASPPTRISPPVYRMPLPQASSIDTCTCNKVSNPQTQPLICSLTFSSCETKPILANAIPLRIDAQAHLPLL